MRALTSLAFLGFVACGGEDEVVWRQFNSDEDTVQIEVRPGESQGVAEVSLDSNIDVTDIGVATVTPARGPVGTEHTLLVEVFDESDWPERVQRATISSAGDRGDESYDLVLDNARPGVFKLVLTSLGEEGESRIDTWRIDLWEAVDNPLPEVDE